MTVKKAREVITRAFKDDPDFRRVYVDNIACILMDNVPCLENDKTRRDDIADKILSHILA